MTLYQDVQIDIETGGTRPDRSPILQIAAVPFNLKEMAISSDVFCQSLHVPPFRLWDESTRIWWSQQDPEVLENILSKRRATATVMEEFYHWACNLGPGLRFWAKPTSFDFPFIASYFNDFELPNPFHYRLATDVNSWINARHFPDPVPKIETTAAITHDALDDCYQQIELVFRHYDCTRKSV